MPDASGRLAVQTALHSTKWWLIIPLEIGGLLTIDMVLDTGSPLSSISERVRDLLVPTGYLDPISQTLYVLRSLNIQGQAIPDLRVRTSRRTTRVGADGVLGLDFLAQFTDVHFHVPSLRLTLTDAVGK